MWSNIKANLFYHWYRFSEGARYQNDHCLWSHTDRFSFRIFQAKMKISFTLKHNQILLVEIVNMQFPIAMLQNQSHSVAVSFHTRTFPFYRLHTIQRKLFHFAFWLMIYDSANSSGEIVKLKSLEIKAANERHQYRKEEKQQRQQQKKNVQQKQTLNSKMHQR